jgi:hypothetical protein
MEILLIVVVLGVVGLLASPSTVKGNNWIDRSGGHRF